MEKTKLNKTYNILLRTLIILVAYGFIYYQLFYEKDILANLDQLWSELSRGSSLYFLYAAVILVFVNWGLETAKWQYLIGKIEQISFLKAYRAVLSGVTVSVFTPNRVGEYFGRVFMLHKANPWKAVFLTVLGSMSQLLVTLSCGSIALIFFVISYDIEFFQDKQYFLWGLIVSVLVFNAFVLMLYFNVDIITKWVEGLLRRNWKRMRNYLKVVSEFHGKELLRVLLFSFLRYVVFSLQYYLLFRAFGIEMRLFSGMMVVSVIFFVLTAIPSVALAELSIRGSVAISVLGLYFAGSPDSFSEIAAATAAGLLWLINIVVPALTGAVFVHKLRFFRDASK